ncbi:hypothetical protein Aazo_1955 ['Nostoc azollae' 0708]|uniref:Uncharacterized protein n=1 Tax=Nostoc azollae (strain 0708) TaxID=551115 RepID=D7DWC2_NOSA0|nr:hypothetical protein Aazo_1955 ['Nostoc azollae' 0708]
MKILVISHLVIQFWILDFGLITRINLGFVTIKELKEF